MNEEINDYFSIDRNREPGRRNNLPGSSERTGGDSGVQRCVEIPKRFTRVERRLHGLGLAVRYIENE